MSNYGHAVWQTVTSPKTLRTVDAISYLFAPMFISFHAADLETFSRIWIAINLKLETRIQPPVRTMALLNMRKMLSIKPSMQFSFLRCQIIEFGPIQLRHFDGPSIKNQTKL